MAKRKPMSVIEMSDHQAAKLLGLMSMYFDMYSSDTEAPKDMTVKEMAGDIINSLPSHMVGVRERYWFL